MAIRLSRIERELGELLSSETLADGANAELADEDPRESAPR